MSETIHVAVAVIFDEGGQVCLSLRHKDSHQGGLWEFPGGKIEHDESVEQALQREIKEELGIDIIDSRPLITIEHDYGDRNVCLHVHRVISFEGDAIGLEGQSVEWFSISELMTLEFPDANHAIIKAIQLPERYLITGKFSDECDFQNKLTNALEDNICLVQLRLKAGDIATLADVQHLVEQASSSCQKHAARLMLNIAGELLPELDLSRIVYSGIHADSKTLNSLTEDTVSAMKSDRAGALLVSASCHTDEELDKAVRVGSDFVVLSPVQKTTSHPDMIPLGWQRFSEMIRGVQIPVYALGGVTECDIETAWSFGGQGVAAISAYWKS